MDTPTQDSQQDTATQEPGNDPKSLQQTLAELTQAVADLREQNQYLRQAVDAMRKQAAKYGDRINVLTDMVADLLMDSDQDTEQKFQTSQENVWRNYHGFRYVVHHMAENWQSTRTPFWEMLLQFVPDCRSILEMGCNIGANLKAINKLNPEIQISGIEINQHAVDVLRQSNVGEIHCGSILEADLGNTFDLVFTRGVLIHINPAELPRVLHNMAKHSQKYVLIYEHYSPTLVQPKGYARRVKGGEAGEGYQFWQDYSGAFSALYPDWTVVQHGIDLRPGRAPKSGSMHWTLFRRPSAETATS